MGEVRPPIAVAQRLICARTTKTIVRHRLLTHDGEPVELSWSYCPVAIAAGSAVASRGKITGEAPQALADLGFPERTFEDRLSVRLPTNWMPSTWPAMYR